MPVADSVEVAAKTVTPTGVSAVVPDIVSGTALVGQVWNVTALDAAIWVKFGPGAPEAAPGAGWLLPAGTSRDFAVTDAAEKCAVRLA
ncbi:hypothetical protein [Caulobacter sp. RHG1]|uniref:hypothetical protein n=1 Tax=Caulobacter sp. (strain RHG1) TaxID=2545762 RepID=UPI001557D9EF|nr:hypothetical protein [Caulobacter sp. RHG1]